MRLTIRNSDGTHSQPTNMSWHDVFMKLARYEDLEEANRLIIKTEDISDYDVGYKMGQLDMFQEVTSIYYGKQYYFPEETGLVYSRESCKYLTKEQAFNEFLNKLTKEWSCSDI